MRVLRVSGIMKDPNLFFSFCQEQTIVLFQYIYRSDIQLSVFAQDFSCYHAVADQEPIFPSTAERLLILGQIKGKDILLTFVGKIKDFF